MASNICGVSSKIDSKRLVRERCNSCVILRMSKRTATPDNWKGQLGSLEVVLVDALNQWYGFPQMINNEKVANCTQHLEVDPVDIPNLTRSILPHLQEVPPKYKNTRLDYVSQLPRPQSLTLECDYHKSPSIWREALMNGYLPWLWDIDSITTAHMDACKQIKGQRPIQGIWDWEMLVRQLAQMDLREPKAVLGDLPMGFRNRVSIWRLVEDILSEKSPNEEAAS